MNSPIIATAALLTALSWSATANAANPEHLRQLLATKQCQNCELTGAGLVMADLAGADLSGANLTGANLSRANLTGANLTGANLSSAGLFGANLNSAKLNGANLSGTDMRETYLANSDFTGTTINTANLQGAIGIPSQVVKPDDLYSLGFAAARKGNHSQAIEYFDQALAMQPDFAGAYLARGVARYQIFDRTGALADAQKAEQLFTSQRDTSGVQTTQAFIKELQAPPPRISAGKPNFLDFLGGLAGLVFQFLPF